MRKINEITGIVKKKKKGIWVEDLESIEDIFIDHFEKFFETTHPRKDKIQNAIEGIQIRVSKVMK